MCQKSAHVHPFFSSHIQPCNAGFCAGMDAYNRVIRIPYVGWNRFFKTLLPPLIGKGRAGFAEQNCAHSALNPLPTAILPFLSKRLATVRDGCPCDLRALKRSRTGFCQDQTSQTRRKGTVRHTRPCKPAGIQNTHHKKRAAEDFCGALVL